MKSRLTLLLMTLLTASLLCAQQAGGPQTFATPEAARDALVQAAEVGGESAKAIFGPGAAEILRTGDPVEDRNIREQFAQRVHEKTLLQPDPMNRDRVTLLVGNEEWPFAVPLVRKDGKWFFDLQAGKQEIRNRVVGGNELDAIEVCRGYVEAQYLYAEKDRDGNGVLEYAPRIFSTPGRKDGLYWEGEDSPVAAGFAKAAAQGYRRSDKPQPFHGYYFKILTAQGPAAKGGEMDYMAKGMMIGGFALVAWPAEYGISGYKTFLVNHEGVVYEKDLGPGTPARTTAMTRFNPDKTWQVSP